MGSEGCSQHPVRTRRFAGCLWLAALSLYPTMFAGAAQAPGRSGTEHSAPLVLAPCALPGLSRPARCGSLVVAENPQQPLARRLSVAVAVVPAAIQPALADPIVVLMGGPGEDAISGAALFVEQFAPLLRERDLLLVDQRGTGKSGALRCQLYSAAAEAVSLRELFPSAAVAGCAKQLSTRADLTQYTFAHFARDLEQVRVALGYGPMNLSAGSYGTRAAQVYLRAYPGSVRTVHLGSVVPIDLPPPLPMAKVAEGALEGVVKLCAADAECHAAFPNLRQELRQVVERLSSGDVSVAVAGRPAKVPLHPGRVAEWLRSLLYRPEGAATVPWLIHRAHAGDFGPIADGILSNARGIDAALSLGLFFSVTCSEDMAFVREEDIVAATQGTFLGDYRVRQQLEACKHWPKAPLPPDYRVPVHSAVPVLFVSGDADGGSPLWFTQRVAPGYANRLEVVLGGRGHTEWSECVGPLYERFVRSGTVRGLDTSACTAVPRPPFKTQ